ncbi:hypothetical protein BgiMline_013100 [Biomphalaria glabrata]|nr:hypothetical protein BgiMline_016914 [Biomphalaria glabrata]KAI8787250.1 hypothetical protein BgiBS90_012388 [Biomphalaria glabrata]
MVTPLYCGHVTDETMVTLQYCGHVTDATTFSQPYVFLLDIPSGVHHKASIKHCTGITYTKRYCLGRNVVSNYKGGDHEQSRLRSPKPHDRCILWTPSGSHISLQ